MATNPKTAVLQIRMAPEQLAKFKLHCDALERGYSDVARTLIRTQIQQWETQLRRVAELDAKPRLPAQTPVPVRNPAFKGQVKPPAGKSKKNRRS